MLFKMVITATACAVIAHGGEPAAIDDGNVLFFDTLAKTRVRATPAKAKNFVELEVLWMLEKAAAPKFQPSAPISNGLCRSVTRIGNTTFTRTLLASKRENAVFIHCLVNKPGELSLRVSIAGQDSTVRIEDRRQLILSPQPEAPAGLAAHVWVLPFESDVASRDSSIEVRGEGEALIILRFSEQNATDRSLADTLLKLGETYDAGHFPPDPSKIWRGVLEAHAAPVDKP